MDRRDTIRKVLVLCSRKPQNASTLREALGHSAAAVLGDLVRAGRLTKHKSTGVMSAFFPRFYWYRTTAAGARHALALIQERRQEKGVEA